jgi:hypothetical protein
MMSRHTVDANITARQRFGTPPAGALAAVKRLAVSSAGCGSREEATRGAEPGIDALRRRGNAGGRCPEEDDGSEHDEG